MTPGPIMTTGHQIQKQQFRKFTVLIQRIVMKYTPNNNRHCQIQQFLLNKLFINRQKFRKISNLVKFACPAGVLFELCNISVVSEKPQAHV